MVRGWVDSKPFDGCRYATACAGSDGLLLFCGGRDANSVVCCDVFNACDINLFLRQLRHRCKWAVFFE